MINILSFVDELEKISGLGTAAKAAVEAVKKIKPSHLKYPAVGLGSIMAVDKLRELKRQRDIGKAYEEAQGG